MDKREPTLRPQIELDAEQLDDVGGTVIMDAVQDLRNGQFKKKEQLATAYRDRLLRAAKGLENAERVVDQKLTDLWDEYGEKK